MAGTAPASTRSSHASPGEDLKQFDVYQGDKLNCDVVMKGGITSGVTYPWAICEIAKKYRLRSIGGTSAGAIAAAAAAAAEVGREVEGAGFVRLADLPRRLSRTPNGVDTPTLLNLFQPQPGTAPFFNLLKTSLQAKEGGRVKQVSRTLQAAFATFWRAALLGALPGLVVMAAAIVLAVTRPIGWFGMLVTILTTLAGLVLALIGGLGLAAFTAAKTAMKSIPGNRFGLCSGFAPAADGAPCSDPDLQPGPAGTCLPKPLTTWLADELDAMAGKTDPSQPLTLGDLCDQGITLKMFTTNLTEGAPYTLPFQTRKFFFAPSEFAELFPPRVVDWMRSRVPEPRTDDERALFDKLATHDPKLLPLPLCEHFPVVLAARMSLSFPILLSAIPLWAVDWTGTKLPGRNWFSDGGITSNFPIHFFDGPLPRWPTFGINLGPMPDADRSQDQSRNIAAPKTNGEAIQPRWQSISSVNTFVHSILDTMQNWLDNAQTRVPGYRDRIVLIKHTKDEGGMNLSMPPDRIIDFSKRGQFAGRWLVNRFSQARSTNPGDRLSWDNHRWVRYRSFMAMMDGAFERLLRGYGFDPAPSALHYPDLIADPPSYQWCPEPQPTAARDLTEAMVKMARLWANVPPGSFPSEPPCQCEGVPGEETFDRSQPFHCGAPHPRPVLRVAPDF